MDGPDAARRTIQTPWGTFTGEEWQLFQDGMWRQRLVEVYGLAPSRVTDTSREELYALVEEAVAARPDLEDAEDSFSRSARAQLAASGQADQAAPALTTTAGLYVDAADPDVRRAVHALLQRCADGELATLLRTADPVAQVALEDAPPVLGLGVTTTDDETADAVLTLLEDLAREQVRPAVDALGAQDVLVTVQTAGLAEHY